MNDEAALKDKVEKLGVSIEKYGRTPIEGRVFAYLTRPKKSLQI